MLEVDWVLHMGMEQFFMNWLSPYHHPLLIQLWNVVPPHVYWGIWKEINEEIVMGSISKLLLENMQNSKWRKLLSLPMVSDQRVAKN